MFPQRRPQTNPSSRDVPDTSLDRAWKDRKVEFSFFSRLVDRRSHRRQTTGQIFTLDNPYSRGGAQFFAPFKKEGLFSFCEKVARRETRALLNSLYSMISRMENCMCLYCWTKKLVKIWRNLGLSDNVFTCGKVRQGASVGTSSLPMGIVSAALVGFSRWEILLGKLWIIAPRECVLFCREICVGK